MRCGVGVVGGGGCWGGEWGGSGGRPGGSAAPLGEGGRRCYPGESGRRRRTPGGRWRWWRRYREDLEELRAVSPAEGLVCRNELGGYLHLGNSRRRVWKPACVAAGVAANPYDGRHTYASLLIHEGQSPLAVAAAMGHASAETTWRHTSTSSRAPGRRGGCRSRRRSLRLVCVQCASSRLGGICSWCPERRNPAPEAGFR